MTLEFYTDNNIKEQWSNTYGKITTITFIVYSEIGDRDMLMLNHAIKDTISIDKFAQVLEYIDLEMAKLFGLYRGTCIQWIFPTELEEADELSDLISEGLEYMKIKNDYLGVPIDVYTRTT